MYKRNAGGLSRRDFLKSAGAMAGGIAASGALPFASMAQSDMSGALQWNTNHNTLSVNDFKIVIENFNEEFPDIAINLINHGDSEQYYTQINTAGVAGTLPDLFYVRSFDVAPFGGRGWIHPLNDLMARDGMDLSDFWPAQVAQNSYEGQLMTLPYDFSNWAIYYNKTMFDEFGVPYPTDDWTWDECYEIAAAFQEGDPSEQTRWGLEMHQWPWLIMGLLHAGGGAIYTDDYRHCIVNNPENVATLQRLQDEMAAGNVVHRGNTPAGLDPFLTGNIAMEVQGSWAAYYILDGIGDSFEWDIVKFPRGSTGLSAVSAAGGAWGIATNTADLDVAWEFCKYITNTESTNILISNQLRSLPGRLSSVPRWEEVAGTDIWKGRKVQVFTDQMLNDAINWSYPVYQGEFDAAWNARIISVFEGNDPEEMLRQVEEEANAAAARYFEDE